MQTRKLPSIPLHAAIPSRATSRMFVVVAYTLLLLLVGTNLPTPLYALYQHRWHFSSGVLTLIFATYAGVLIPSLLLFGSLSDVIGRRRVLLPAMGLAALGSLVLAVAQGVAWLFAARALQGIAIGAFSGAATAALAELHPRHDRSRASLVATTVTVTGGALGPVLAGILAQYAPLPFVTPYALQLALLLPAVVALWLLRDAEPPHPVGVRWRPRRPSVPAGIRGPFALAGATAFLSWAVVAVFLALGPSFVSGLLRVHNLALAGAIVSVLLGTSAVTQLALRGWPSERAIALSLPLLVLGLVLVALAVPVHAPVLFLAGMICAGAGQGLTFLGGMRIINDVAPVERRADVLSSFYVTAYLGIALPVLGVGFGAQRAGLYPAVLAFSIVLGVLLLGAEATLVLTASRRSADHARTSACTPEAGAVPSVGETRRSA